jgi:hypothetical protein
LGGGGAVGDLERGVRRYRGAAAFGVVHARQDAGDHAHKSRECWITIMTNKGKMSWSAGGLLAAAMTLTACVGSQSLEQPLSPLVARSELVDRAIIGTENGQTSFIRLAQNGVAALNGPSAELGHWQFDEKGALCLQWPGQPQRCAPVYATGGSQYRFGEMNLSVLSSR